MRSPRASVKAACGVLVACLLATVPLAQEASSDLAHRKPFDQILDLYVRDGLVYYRALKAERSKLDGFVNQLGAEQVNRLSKDEQIAFWLNAYNALVLETVIDHYPIRGTSKSYPPDSIRQIPGAFERLTHRVGGSMLTLDQIEQTILPKFHDPRVFLALGRGALGSGRLRSEMFAAATVEAQLADTASECVTRSACVQVDRAANTLIASSIFSWRERDFTTAYAEQAPAVFSSRTPIERAVIAFIEPRLLTIERDLLATNTFKVEYRPFNWSLNDLTGRGGR